MVPNQRYAIALLKKYSHDNKGFKIVLSHSKSVMKVAAKIGKKVLWIDMQLVKIGSLLHDIGRFDFPPSKGKLGIRHGIHGAEILRKEGIDKEICLICERHIGIGISKKDIVKQKLPLPKKDFLPISKEEKIVAYADNLIFGNKVGTEKMVEDRFAKEIGPEYGKRTKEFHKSIHSLFK